MLRQKSMQAKTVEIVNSIGIANVGRCALIHIQLHAELNKLKLINFNLETLRYLFFFVSSIRSHKCRCNSVIGGMCPNSATALENVVVESAHEWLNAFKSRMGKSRRSASARDCHQRKQKTATCSTAQLNGKQTLGARQVQANSNV